MGRRQWDKPTHERLLSSTTSLLLALVAFLPPPPPPPPRLVLFLAPPLASLAFSPSSSSSSLPADPYDGIHLSFLRPRINTIVWWKRNGPARKPRSVNSLSVSPFLAPFPFGIYFLLGRRGKRSGRDVYGEIRRAEALRAESNQSLSPRPRPSRGPLNIKINFKIEE